MGLPKLIPPWAQSNSTGPYLPLGTDVTIALALAEKTANEVDVVVAPPLYYASFFRDRRVVAAEPSMEALCSGRRCSQALSAVLNECLRQVFSRLILLNGHFENADPAFEVPRGSPGSRR